MSKDLELVPPALVAARAASFGSVGHDWLASLPALVHRLCLQWKLVPGGVFDGGSESLVVAVTTAEGEDAILKIGLPGSSDTVSEARIYSWAQGHGYPRLYETDVACNAILLERLGPTLHSAGFGLTEQYRLICVALESAWFPPPDGHALMSGAGKARYLATFITKLWNDLGAPGSQQILDRALAFASEREAAHNDAACVMVHGDCHAMNTLRTLTSDGDAPVYKFVDPDGLWAEPAYDPGILMRDDNDSLVQGDVVANGIARCQLLAGLSGCTERAIWQWGFVERVSTGLHLIEIGQRDWGRASLAIAEQWHELNP